MRRSGGRGRDQRFERAFRALPARLVEQSVSEVEAEADVVELERELLDVEVGTEVLFRDRLPAIRAMQSSQAFCFSTR